MNFERPISIPEEQLLLLSARRAWTQDQSDEIHHLLAQPLDWRFILNVAGRHRLLTLLYAAMRQEDRAPLVPPQAFRALYRASQESVGQSLAMTAELVRILRVFRETDIPAIPCKGPVVAMAAYGDISYRSFCDLDILVPESYFHSAKRALNDIGYRPRLRLSGKQERVYLKNECALQFTNTAGSVVELHWRFCERNASVDLPVEAFRRRCVDIPLPGISVAGLAPEDLVLYLCVHGAKHQWERLEWIACLAELIRRHPNLHWEAAFQSAAEYRVARLLNIGLHLAVTLLDAEVPKSVIERIAADPQVRVLASLVSRGLFAPATAQSHYQQRAARYLFMMRTREHWIDRARILLYSAIRPPHPDANEWMHLPPHLAFLHRIFRPARLLGEYSVVAWRHYLR